MNDTKLRESTMNFVAASSNWMVGRGTFTPKTIRLTESAAGQTNNNCYHDPSDDPVLTAVTATPPNVGQVFGT
jgi:hypothetical protein